MDINAILTNLICVKFECTNVYNIVLNKNSKYYYIISERYPSNKIKQNEETVFTGVELKSHFNTTDTFATLNFGYEHANKFSINNLSTTGVSGTSDINLGSSIDKTRPVLMASFNKDLDQAGRLSLNFDRIHLEIEAILHASERLG